MSSKQSISKHRAGGPHSGQSQSNQRLDYSRSNQDRMQHNLRTQNSGTTHMPTVNMAAQPAPNVQASPQQQFGAFTSGQRLPPHLANNIPNAPQIPARSLRPIPPRLPPNNYNIRSTYPNNVSNQHFQTQQNPYYSNYYQPAPQLFQIQIPNQNLYSYNYPYILENSNNYQRNIYPTQPPINLNSTTINNNEMRQNFRQNNGLTKRERKPAIVLNDDGTKIDLEALAKANNQEKTLDKAINLDSKSLNGSNKNVGNVDSKLNEEKVNNTIDMPNMETKEEPVCSPKMEHTNQDAKSPEDTLDYSTSCDNTKKLNEPDTPMLVENETRSEQNDLDKLADDFEHITLETPEDSVNNVDIVEDVKTSPSNLETGETKPETPVKEAQTKSETIESLPSQPTESVQPSLPEQPEPVKMMKQEQPEPEEEMIVEQDIQLEPNNNDEKLEEETISHDETSINCENIASGDNNLETELDNAQLDNEIASTSIVENEISNETVETAVADKEIDLEEGELVDEEESLENTLQNNMIYPREFLLSRREHASDYALTNSNRDNIKDIVKRPSPPNSRSSEALLPDYLLKNRPQLDTQFRNKSMIQNYRRQAQPSRNYSNEKSRKIVSTSLSGPSRPLDDGWRPGKLTSLSTTDAETDTLLKNVRATLNKLTPQNYRTLLSQFKSFKIDTKDRLQQVITLIFDKAVREPAFVVQYAGFCSELIHIVVKDTEKNEQVNFKSLLIEQCQNTFYQNIYEKEKIQNIQKEVEETTDPVRKKELEDMMDDEKRLERKRSVGNIKLIAELFKLKMLNTQIMFTCFSYLLKNSNEEYIECLCALITNIGQKLTELIDGSKNQMVQQRAQFEIVFNELTAIHQQKSKLKASARIRFMILDLLDLRKNNWVPRRKVEGPKLIAQVHEEMEMQQKLKIEELKKKKIPANPQIDEWTPVNKRKSSHSGMPTKNLASLSVLKDISENNNRLNALANFSIFKTGSHGGSTPHSQSRSSSTNYESKNQATQNDKNQRVFHDSLNAKMQSGRRDERKVSEVYYQSDKSRNASSQSQPRSDSSDNLNVPDLNPMEFAQKVNTTLQEYFKSEQNISDTMKNLNTYCSRRKYADFIYHSILGTLEKTSQTFNPREKWGVFLGKFFLNSCENSDIFESLKNVFAQYEDIRLDIPKFFEFIAEILAYALLTISKEDPLRKKEVVKTLVEAYNEISGSECQLFRNSLLDTIKNTKDAEKLFKEIEPLFQSDSKIKEFDKLSDILTDCLKKNNVDLNELIDQIKNSYPDKLSNENFKSALYYSLIDVAFNQTDDFNDVSNNLNKIQNVIKYFVKSQDDQVVFLIECSNFIKRMNNPSNLLNDIFSYLKLNNLFNDASFIQWSSDKRTPVITKASAQRFLETIQRKNI